MTGVVLHDTCSHVLATAWDFFVLIGTNFETSH